MEITPEQRLAARSAIYELVARNCLQSLAQKAPDPQAFLRATAEGMQRGFKAAAGNLPPEAAAVVDEALAEMMLSVQQSTFDDIAAKMAKLFPMTRA